MKTIRSDILALACFFLLLVPVSCFAQTNTVEAVASASSAPAGSCENAAAPRPQTAGSLAGPPGVHTHGQAESSPIAAAFDTHLNVRALFAQPTAFSLDQAGSSGQQQTKPSSGNEPSLEGLGFPKSEIQGSAKEQALLDKRSHMLQIHQKLGLLTAIPMVAMLITGPGAKGHHGLPGSPTGRDVHAGLGILTAGMYFATAYYAIRAPKVPETKSYGLIRLHKALAWIHGPGMVITPILGAIAFSQLSNGERIHGIAKYHSWAAYTTAAAYGAALLSVTLK